MGSVSTMIVLGSGKSCLSQAGIQPSAVDAPLASHAGGHTAEMLALVAQMDKQRYSPRCYVVSRTDAMGAQKALTAEQGFASSSSSPTSVRCKSVQEPYSSAGQTPEVQPCFAGRSSQGCSHPTQQGGWAVLPDQHLDHTGGHLGSTGHGVEREAPAG